MIVGTATPEAQALDEALPRDWYVKAENYEDNPAAEGYPHHPSEYEYGRSPCYVSIVRTGKKAEYSRRREEYYYSDDPQWWVSRHCPADKGVPRHDLDATKGAHDGREAARIAAEFARGKDSGEVSRPSEFRRDDDFDLSGWR